MSGEWPKVFAVCEREGKIAVDGEMRTNVNIIDNNMTAKPTVKKAQMARKEEQQTSAMSAAPIKCAELLAIVY